MGAVADRIEACVKSIREITDFVPKTAIVLGSGLGSFADRVENPISVEYGSIPGFPVSTVAGHAGRFILGCIEAEPVAVMQGRVHFYEGYSMEDVVLPIRVLHALGAERIILTNAAGGIREDLAQGALMLITDHISSFVPSPLIGENEASLGERFPDMSKVYSTELREKAKAAADALGIQLKEGVYVQVTGPNYETPAEIRMYRLLGAAAVGMSTVCEAIAAHHVGMQICGISCITNAAADVTDTPLSHVEVQAAAKRISGEFQALLLKLIASL